LRTDATQALLGFELQKTLPGVGIARAREPPPCALLSSEDRIGLPRGDTAGLEFLSGQQT
jgi:hypothetical protein